MNFTSKNLIDGYNKKSVNTFLRSHISRWLADSNRRKRFCRPVTKPLIQTTKRTLCLNSSAKVQLFSLPPNKTCKKSTFFVISHQKKTSTTLITYKNRYKTHSYKNHTSVYQNLFLTEVRCNSDALCNEIGNWTQQAYQNEEG